MCFARVNCVMRTMMLVLSLVLAGFILWDSASFFNNEGKMPVWQVVTILWAICSGVIYGVDFTPKHNYWYYLFFPPLAFVVIMLIYINNWGSISRLFMH